MWVTLFMNMEICFHHHLIGQGSNTHHNLIKISHGPTYFIKPNQFVHHPVLYLFLSLFFKIILTIYIVHVFTEQTNFSEYLEKNYRIFLTERMGFSNKLLKN